MFKAKDSFTLANAALGVMAVAFLSFGYLVSFSLILLAILFDFFDGYHSRKTKTSNDFGKQLDSLADTVSFVVAPGLIVLFSVTNKVFEVEIVLFALLSVIVFVMAGLTRLAKFNLQKNSKVYYGLPVPYAALFFMGLTPFLGFNPVYAGVLGLVIAGLMVSNIKGRKLA
ncbi:MAG: CDP-diacylglycerol--serine O-phosphatidyltransferase [Candidatus Micrarchaeota archaeon]